ncbi:hypothetical protein HNQ60_002140 [Povalibacter uvarum]|uniref:Uncharacterized protein n=1 Tax=Povalibacter uvarum TaxID=732238 RepID=A0A841HME4_9GAMM|nr:hypothetical protein [Povalibacter uvarum]MBB6093262.1 hypothetical protein [Povalibacter uvarum]
MSILAFPPPRRLSKSYPNHRLDFSWPRCPWWPQALPIEKNGEKQGFSSLTIDSAWARPSSVGADSYGRDAIDRADSAFIAAHRIHVPTFINVIPLPAFIRAPQSETVVPGKTNESDEGDVT